MPNWTAITSDTLKAYAYGAIVDRAASLSVGGIDPVAEAIAGAVARVRRAVATANRLDADTTKVPNSLRAVAVRLAVFVLMERIGLDLSEDQRNTSRDDMSDLKRIADNRIGVEAPDDPAANAGEMQSGKGGVQSINMPCRQTGRGRTSGL